MKRNKKKQKAKSHRRGQRYEAEEKKKALELLRRGMKATEVSRTLGPSTETLRLWKHQEKQGTQTRKQKEDPSALVPLVSPGRLSPVEVKSVLELKRRHPSYGPAQVQAQLQRFKGWRLSRKAIARIFKDHGYELVHVASRPQGDEEPRRWEAPRRNALWQLDATDLRVGPDKRVLVVGIDDFSRFVVGWTVLESPTGEKVVEMLREAFRKHGKAEAVYTDRAGMFLDWGKETSFQRFLAHELIDHIVSRPYHPQGRGKIEALFKTIRRELWDVRHFESWDEAVAALAEWLQAYNARRAHMGIDGLTPADRFFGRWDEVRGRIEAAARGRLATGAPSPNLFEDEAAGCGVEVLRLMAIDGSLELRFLGRRIRLGTLDK